MGLVQIGGEIRSTPLNQNFQYLDGKHLYGDDAAKPSPAQIGRLYVALDTGIIYADIGTAWIPVGGGSVPAHASTHATGGSDPLPPMAIGAASQVDFDAHLAEKVMDAEGAHGLTYEEGVWTPTIVGSTVPGSHTYAIQVGIYIRVNNLVHVQFRVDMSAKDPTMSGNARIAGLPFISKYNAAIAAYFLRANLPAGRTDIFFILLPNVNFIQLNDFGAGAALPLSVDAIRDDTSIVGSFTYVMG